MRFEGAERDKTYVLTINGRTFEKVSGTDLSEGFWTLEASR
jgi:hypothetical protein